MRIGLLCLLLPAMALPARGTEFYVSPAGSDGGAGTLQSPFATVQRAQEAAAPGDTVFIRGGTYRPTEAQIAYRKGIFAHITHLDKSGQAEKPIRYWAYPGERPVFDCSAVKPPQRVDAFFVSASWVHLKGLEVTGVLVTLTNHTQAIGFENDGSHNIYEQLSIHDGQAIGIYSVRGSDNLFLNCDAWNNRDFTSDNGKGGNTDGFGCHPTKGATNIIFRGCRAWFNSDDGFDCINAREAVTFENCWAFGNGCNFNMQGRLSDNLTEVDGRGHTLRNNASAASARLIDRFDAAASDASQNSFDLGLRLGDRDFLSVDARELTQPRQANGDLPAIRFLHPSPGSGLIDAGADIGFPFFCAAPDLGAFEAPRARADPDKKE